MIGKKITFFHSNRSEEGLIKPVIKALNEKGFLAEMNNLADKTSLFPPWLSGVYEYVYNLLLESKPDLVFTPFDRCEMVFATLAAFYRNIPIAQMHAGDISKGTWDDVTRHVISLYSTLHFCNGQKAADRVKALLNSIGKDSAHVYEVGSTAFDDVELDNTIVPQHPYALVLYMPSTTNPETIFSDLKTIEETVLKWKEDHDLASIWIKPSDKVFIQPILDVIDKLEKQGAVKVYDSLPRPQFLALMKDCRFFIGNSSSQLYEAPLFLHKEQIIHIGLRNKGREQVKIRPGGSQRIADIVENFLNDK